MFPLTGLADAPVSKVDLTPKFWELVPCWPVCYESYQGGAISVSRTDEYRRRAQQCLEMAGTFRDREARAILSHMAQVWQRLADNCDANEIVGRSKAAEQARPIAQQQQQIQPKKKDEE